MNFKSIFLSLSAFFLTMNVMAVEQKFSSSEIEAEIRRLTSDIDVIGLTYNQIKSINDYQLLDARTKDEFNISHLNNAHFVNYDDFDYQKLKKKLNKNKPILVYCSIGYRSGKVASTLKEKGYKVFNLLGGIFEWVNNNKTVYHEGKPTSKVHGYNESWGKWLVKGDVIYK